MDFTLLGHILHLSLVILMLTGLDELRLVAQSMANLYSLEEILYLGVLKSNPLSPVLVVIPSVEP